MPNGSMDHPDFIPNEEAREIGKRIADQDRELLDKLKIQEDLEKKLEEARNDYREALDRLANEGGPCEETEGLLPQWSQGTLFDIDKEGNIEYPE